MNKKHYIIPIFVPHRGCPNDCVFCNQKKITGLSTEITVEDMKNIVDEYLKTMPKENSTIEIAFYGGSFTGIDEEIQRMLLECAKGYKDNKNINKIRLSTRPDYIDYDKLLLLKENGVDTIELGVQSLDDDVLYKSKRGHTALDVYKAVELIKSFNFEIGLQMMIGLYGDTKEKSIDTAKKIINLKPDFVRIYPTLIVKDTYLQKLYLEEKYNPLSLEEAIDVCCDLLMLFRYNDILVIRLGLQPTENITLTKDVIEGPFHPSFRQLVESKIYFLVLDHFFKNKLDKFENIVINVNKKEIPNLVGQKSYNINTFKKIYNIKNIKVIGIDIDCRYILIKTEDEIYEIEIDKYIENYLIKNSLVL